MLEAGEGSPIGSQLHGYNLPLPHAVILGQPQQSPLLGLVPWTVVQFWLGMVLVTYTAIFSGSFGVELFVGYLIPVNIWRVLELLRLRDGPTCSRVLVSNRT